MPPTTQARPTTISSESTAVPTGWRSETRPEHPAPGTRTLNWRVGRIRRGAATALHLRLYCRRPRHQAPWTTPVNTASCHVSCHGVWGKATRTSDESWRQRPRCQRTLGSTCSGRVGAFWHYKSERRRRPSPMSGEGRLAARSRRDVAARQKFLNSTARGRQPRSLPEQPD